MNHRNACGNWAGIARIGIIAVVACLWLSNVSRASLIMPDLPKFTFDSTADKSAGPSSDPATKPIDTHGHDWHRRMVDNNVILGTHGSSAGTSTSSPKSPTQSNNAVALTGLTDVLNADPALAGWLRGSLRAAIPMPPVNSLLRPPQV